MKRNGLQGVIAAAAILFLAGEAWAKRAMPQLDAREISGAGSFFFEAHAAARELEWLKTD